jgi:hypothetical protein
MEVAGSLLPKQPKLVDMVARDRILHNPANAGIITPAHCPWFVSSLRWRPPGTET